MRKLFTLLIFALGFYSFTFAKTYNTYNNSSDVTVLASQYTHCGGGENPEKLLDGNINTKWCSWLTGDQGGANIYANRTSDKIVWKTASPIVVTSYTLTTGNDTKGHPQRQWKSWTIYGGNFANDDAAGNAIGTNTGWTVIDQVENDSRLPMENHQTASYDCAHPAEYTYYRLVIDAVHQEYSDHSDIQQMSELTMKYLLASKVTAAPTAKSLVYNGSAQQLVNAGTANGGTMYYRLYNSDWSTSIPTATESGTYTVYYKVVGDDTHIDSSEASLNVTIGVASQYSEGPWTPTDRKTAYCEVNKNNRTSISWNDLDNTMWSGKATVYRDNTNGIGSQIQATTIDYSKQAIYTLYTATQTIPSYSEMVWNWSFRMSGQYTNLAQQIGLYAGTNLSTLKATALDFTHVNETQAGSDICVGLYSHYAGHPGASFSQEASHDIRLDNRNGSTDLEQTVYMIQTHIICSYGAAGAFGNQWMAFKHLNNSYTYNYFKYITFNANGGSGSMAQQTIENSGNLTANAFTYAHKVFNGWSDGVNTYTDQATVTATADSKGSITLTAQWIDAPAATCTPPTAIEGLVYNGSEQTLVTAGLATGGEMQYKVDDGAWSAELPKAEAIGDHTVSYKVAADDNHTDVDEASFVVSIAPVTEFKENEDPTTPLTGLVNSGAAYNISMERTIYAMNYYNTICLPFSVSAAELTDPSHPLYGYSQLMAFDGAEVTGSGQNIFINVYVAPSDHIEAGIPYFISYPTSHGDIVNPTFPNVTCTQIQPGSVTKDGVTFQGMFGPVHITTYEENVAAGSHDDYLFLGSNNRLLWPNNDGTSMRGFRAYFILHRDYIPASHAPRGSNARIVMRENTTTDVETVTGNPSPVTEKVIENGVLYIIMNGVKYNAQGQVVK